MNSEKISAILASQRKLFASGATLDYERRASALDALYAAVRRNEARIAGALRADLGKSAEEAYLCETGLLLSEIAHLRRHLRGYMRPKHTLTGLAQFPGLGELRYVPYGAALIMSPWNYPLLLSLEPLAAALAAGNTAVVKPSAYSPATGELVAKLLGETFPSEYVAAVTGGREENRALLEQKWDKIFFTGGAKVGREVLRAAADNLTSVTLELGGKSPVIVDASADVRLAARRIVQGKFLNCGQTCVAPDYILCAASVREKLVEAICREIRRQYGEQPLQNPDYGRIVNQKHFDRLCGLMADTPAAIGGQSDPGTLRIAPTVLDGVGWDHPAMQEEIFGPILPVIPFDALDEAVAFVRAGEKPLALYLFTKDRSAERRVLDALSFGGGCINDTIIHLATTHMGFGGVGQSGMGSYHGRRSFETFSHMRSIVKKACWLDLPMRYPPYSRWKDRMVRMFLR